MVGAHSHFFVQPNYSVEVVLLVVSCCRWGCDNILQTSQQANYDRRTDGWTEKVTYRGTSSALQKNDSAIFREQGFSLQVISAKHEDSSKSKILNISA